MAVLLLVAGTETTVSLIDMTIYALLTHPAELRRLREAPWLLPAAVEEALGWESPVQRTWRIAKAEVELDGHRIPAGALVVLFLGAANRDPARFATRTGSILRRDLGHLAFSAGVPRVPRRVPGPPRGPGRRPRPPRPLADAPARDRPPGVAPDRDPARARRAPGDVVTPPTSPPDGDRRPGGVRPTTHATRETLQRVLTRLDIPRDYAAVLGVWPGPAGSLVVQLSPGTFWRTVQRAGLAVTSTEHPERLFPPPPRVRGRRDRRPHLLGGARPAARRPDAGLRPAAHMTKRPAGADSFVKLGALAGRAPRVRPDRLGRVCDARVAVPEGSPRNGTLRMSWSMLAIQTHLSANHVELSAVTQ